MARIDEALVRFGELRQDLDKKFEEIQQDFSLAVQDLISATLIDESTGLGNSRSLAQFLEVISHANAV